MITYILIGVAVIGLALYFKPSNKDTEPFSDISVSDLAKLEGDKNSILIDVRTKREINQGVIGQPLEIELGAGMQQKFSELDKNKKYIVYCRSGRRSALASKVMKNMGFKDVNNLLGGYVEWKASNA